MVFKNNDSVSFISIITIICTHELCTWHLIICNKKASQFAQFTQFAVYLRVNGLGTAILVAGSELDMEALNQSECNYGCSNVLWTECITGLDRLDLFQCNKIVNVKM